MKYNQILRFSVLFFSTYLIGEMALAQCGVTMSCGPIPGLLDPNNPPGVCTGNACFKNMAAKEKHEKDYNCLFPADALCNGKAFKSDLSCCGKNANNGKDEIQIKQSKTVSAGFKWEDYIKQCPNIKQSEGESDNLWSRCAVGQRHSASDTWPVQEVEANPNNPNARSYCIDGCSTPPVAINSLKNTGHFIFADKDNPTGAGVGGIGGATSFYGACATHDRCYQSCEKSKDQDSCDNQLLQNMMAVCNAVPANHITTFINNLGFSGNVNTRSKCIGAANKMHTGVYWGGKNAFNLRRQQYCQCC